MLAEFISPDDRRWKELLTRVNHDFYHLPEYISFAARHEGGRPCAFFAETGSNALLVPLLMRDLPRELDPEPGLCDVLTPYGYPGPILAGDPTEETVAEMLQGFLRVSRQRAVVSAFWRLHPLLSFPLEPLRKMGVLVRHGNTVYVDLSQPPEQMWRETSNNHRRHIKQLQRNGFVAVRNDWRYWQSFIEIYWETMARVEASEFYFFPADYFEELKETLGDRLDLWTVLSPQGEVASAAIFVTVKGIVQYHLGATTKKFLDMSPLKLIISEVRLWGCRAGHRLLHLGGGNGGAMDSLYTFKARFSPLSAGFYTFRATPMPNAYADLTLKRLGAAAGKDGNDDGFFPAYRRPS
jgi:hypothetical protein